MAMEQKLASLRSQEVGALRQGGQGKARMTWLSIDRHAQDVTLMDDIFALESMIFFVSCSKADGLNNDGSVSDS